MYLYYFSVKKRRTDVDSDDSDFDRKRSSYDDTRVFDSDEDSDIEISDELTGDKKKVFDFLQTATPNELRLMPSCSQKKVDIIVGMRPFRGWIDLVNIFFINTHTAYWKNRSQYFRNIMYTIKHLEKFLFPKMLR